MDFAPRERLGIFLIAVSFWYLINVKIFNALHPILAIPGSLIFITGLWLLLSPPMTTTRTSMYIPAETPVQATQPVTAPLTEPTPNPTSKSKRKTAKKSKSKP